MGARRRKLLVMTTALVVAWLPGSAVLAGGPLYVRSNGNPYVWATMPIPYQTDSGPLSATVTEGQAQSRVAAMFTVWQDVPTSRIAYTRAGPVQATTGFSGGDVSTAAEWNAVHADCANGVQSPIVYDADGTIFTDLGYDITSIVGFATPCIGNPIISGEAMMNGLFQDGVNAGTNKEVTAALFDAAFIHEFGHFSGLDHSQINLNCFTGPFCTADDLEGVPTMFPFLIDESQGVLADDDKAWISRLYPQTSGATTFANTYGTIRGTVFFSDGQSRAQFVNVIARRVDTGANEDRRNAVSVSSGFKARVNWGNPINGGGDSFGSTAAGDIGLFEIPVPAGSYTVEVESVDPNFVDGSRIGGWPYSDRILMPGTAPAPLGPIVVAAGATVSGNDIVLIGTDPRFDQFEGP